MSLALGINLAGKVGAAFIRELYSRFLNTNIIFPFVVDWRVHESQDSECVFCMCSTPQV